MINTRQYLRRIRAHGNSQDVVRDVSPDGLKLDRVEYEQGYNPLESLSRLHKRLKNSPQSPDRLNDYAESLIEHGYPEIAERVAGFALNLTLEDPRFYDILAKVNLCRKNAPLAEALVEKGLQRVDRASSRLLSDGLDATSKRKPKKFRKMSERVMMPALSEKYSKKRS